MDIRNIPSPAPVKMTIQGLEFTFHPRYFNGQNLTLSAGEAAAFNRLLSENLRNNFANRIKARREELSLAEGDSLDEDSIASLQAYFAEYEFNYMFSVASPPRPQLDPIAALAAKLAREALATHLRRQGKALKDFSEAEIEEKISIALSRNPSFREEAERRIAAARGVAEATFDF